LGYFLFAYSIWPREGTIMARKNERLEEAKAEAERLRMEIVRLVQKIEIALSVLAGKKEE